MADKYLKEYYDEGNKAGSTSDPSKPVVGGDLVAIQRINEANQESAICIVKTTDLVNDTLVGVFEPAYEETTTQLLAASNPSYTENTNNNFGGWGTIFTKNGLTFNTIKIPKTGKANGSSPVWAFAKIQVRDTPATFNDAGVNNATLLAESPLIAIPADNVIENILFPLADPTNVNNFIELNNDSFSGATYFVGVTYYAANGTTIAPGGYPTGTIGNHTIDSGSSYYRFYRAPVNERWILSSSSPIQIVFEHYYTGRILTGFHLNELDSTKLDKVALDYSSPQIMLPDTIYAVVGDKLQLFYKGFIRAIDLYQYNILITCAVGSQYPRYYEYTPVVGDIGTKSFKVELKDNAGNVVTTKTVNIVISAAPANPVSTKKVLCIGDSLTSQGEWCHEADRRLTGNVQSGDPTYNPTLGLTNLDFVGRKTLKLTGYEGTGGWNFADYVTEGADAYRITVSGVTSLSLDALYTNNSSTFQVREINVTGGTGNVLMYKVSGTNAPSASGTMTKTTGTGDGTITYSAVSVDVSNMFWDDSIPGLNFQKYVYDYCGEGIVDIVAILLSWNGIRPFETDYTDELDDCRTFLRAILDHNENVKVLLMGIQMPSLNGGVGANYGATGTSYADQYGIIVGAMNYNNGLQLLANEEEFSSWVKYIDTACQFDSENNMQESDVPVNSRSAKTEKRGTNGLHPGITGYYQIADVVYRSIGAVL